MSPISQLSSVIVVSPQWPPPAPMTGRARRIAKASAVIAYIAATSVATESGPVQAA